MKEYVTYCGEPSWRNSKVTNSCNNFENRVVVAVWTTKVEEGMEDFINHRYSPLKFTNV